MHTIIYKTGSKNDLHAIAQLHAQSWQDHYRGSFKDDYLDGPVFEERLNFWTKRFEQQTSNRYILLANSNKNLAGFGCLFLDENSEYGSLIDNLHVYKEYKGLGIGRQLMDQLMAYIKKHAQSKSVYLWVLTENKGAIGFYEKVGGKITETKVFDNPGGGSSEVYRIVWKLD